MIEAIKIVVEVARLSPFPMGKFGVSFCKKDHVEISPPIFPNITFVPIAEERAVSDTTFAETWALHRAPNENAPLAIMKVAPYRMCGEVLARNMI